MRPLAALLVAALMGCSSPAPSVDDEGPAGAWRDLEPASGASLPHLSFEGVNAEGELTTLSLEDYRDPAADDLLLITLHGGLWCGTCVVAAEGEQEAALAEAGLSDRVTRLDLVASDRDNNPAIVADAVAWQAAFAARGPVAVGADPSRELAALQPSGVRLPWTLVVRRRDMRIVDRLSNPSPGQLAERVAATLGESRPASEPLVDDLFLPHEWTLLARTVRPDAPPADPSNAVADLPEAARLGARLFFDAGLSPSGDVACATCHQPDAQLADGLPVALGVGEGTRRTPAIALAAHARWQLWDGRADSLWAQALAPFEAELEMASSRVHVVRRILSEHLDAYLEAFPGEPTTIAASWPLHGRPGDAGYDALPAIERDRITAIFVNAGKAIAAWERQLRVLPNAFDAYLAGDVAALDPEAKYGLLTFVRSGCMQCHWGPRLTDDAFHNLGLPLDDQAPDAGRLDGVTRWLQSEFRRDGRWSDDTTSEPRAARPHATLLGQFKTPPLRGVAGQSHFTHRGAFGHLAEMTDAYAWGGLSDAATVGEREPWLVGFGETESWGLVPFLNQLTAEPILPRP